MDHWKNVTEIISVSINVPKTGHIGSFVDKELKRGEWEME